MAKARKAQAQQPAVVVAIDFGTTRSGFAYAFTADQRVVGCNVWPGQPTAYPKTSTELLYGPLEKDRGEKLGPRRQVVAWGHPAAREYAQLRRRGEAGNYDLLRGFAAELGQAELCSPHGLLGEDSGRQYPIVDVLGDYLGAMKAMAWEKIRHSTAGELAEREVLWCLTVPHAWAEPKRRLMRQAARKAGLISSRARDSGARLVLVSDADAAAVHCQEKGGRSLSPGSRLIIVDGGGTTIGVTAFRVTGKGTLHRLGRPGGKHSGSLPAAADVDRVFVESILAEKLTAEVLEVYRRDEPVDFLETMAEWERLKCHFDPARSLGACCLPFRPRLLRLLTTSFPAVYDDLTRQGHEDGIYIEPGEMEALFAPAVAETAKRIRKSLSRLDSRKGDFLYLCGGLFGSPLVRQQIRKRFARAFHSIVVPSVPGAAVVEGAVSFALQSSLVRVRRSRLSYGCGCETLFDPARDDESRKVSYIDLDKAYCKDRFLTFVKAGETVPVGHRVSHVLSPMTRAQTEILVDLYASGKAAVRYLDDDGVERLPELLVKLPDIADVDCEVEISMCFGESRIEVTALDRSSGRSRRTSLRFSPEFSPQLLGE